MLTGEVRLRRSAERRRHRSNGRGNSQRDVGLNLTFKPYCTRIPRNHPQTYGKMTTRNTSSRALLRFLFAVVFFGFLAVLCTFAVLPAAVGEARIAKAG